MRIKRDIKDLRIVKKRKLTEPSAHAQISGKTIYVTSKTSKHSLEHEKGHYALGHNVLNYPAQARHYVREEIDANLYAYEKTGQPKGIITRLYGIFSEVKHNYKIPTDLIVSYIREQIIRKEIPPKWKSDFITFMRKYKKAYN